MEKVREFKRRRPVAYTWVISILCFLFVIFMAFLGGGLGWNTSQRDRRQSRNTLTLHKQFIYNSVTGDFHLGSQQHPDVPALSGHLAVGTVKNWYASPCADYTGLGTCVQWDGQARLLIETQQETTSTCYTVTWKSLSEKFVPKDCFSIGNFHWYGGAEVFNQSWPIESGTMMAMFPFLSGGDDIGPYDEALVERYWLSSSGVGIKADDSIPLFVDWNANHNKQFCLVSKYSRPYQQLGSSLPTLKYHICQSSDLKSVHMGMAAKFFPKPRRLPDTRMLLKPVWSTWAKYHADISTSKVLSMAKEISSEGYSHSQLEIDDMYSTSYGAIDFDPNTFPNATEMIKALKSMDMRVTAWVHPFTNVDSPVFEEGVQKGYWVRDTQGKVPALVKWWDGVGAILDVTNPEARKWFTDRLKTFRDTYDIDSFKFDAGSMQDFPSSYKLHSPPNSTVFFTSLYVQMCAEFGPMVEVRVAYRNQDQPIFFRLQDMESVWGYENGLKSLIPRVLYFGIVGYPFVLPDMIGGNAYNGEFPDRELFIRWMQVSAFLPSWQFSITPNQYDNATGEIAKNMMEIRENFLKPYLLKYAEAAVKTGMPIIRPLWWLAPSDDIAQSIDSQFLVGDEVLVAPVVEKGAVSRDVYLPSGRWRDESSGKVLQGSSWIRDHPVPLETIAYFVRQN